MSIVFFLLLTVNKRRKLKCMLQPRAKLLWQCTICRKGLYDLTKFFMTRYSLEQSFPWPGTSGAKFFMTRYTLKQSSAWLGRVLSKVLNDQLHSWAKFNMTRHTLDQSSSLPGTLLIKALHDKVQLGATFCMISFILELSSLC